MHFGMLRHALSDSSRSSGVSAFNSSTGRRQTGENEQGMQLRSVLRQLTVARPVMLELLLQHMGRMLVPSAHTGLGVLQFSSARPSGFFFIAFRTLRFIAMCQMVALFMFPRHLSAP